MASRDEERMKSGTVSRRSFLKQVGASSAALAGAPMIAADSAEHVPSDDITRKSVFLPDPQEQGTIEYIDPAPPAFKVVEFAGDYYEATVPATLDLAERARLVVHAMTNMVNPNLDDEMYFAATHLSRPPAMEHSTSDLDTWGKWVESTALMRVMSGSRENLYLDQKRMEMLLKMQGPDGILYSPMTGRDWTMYPNFNRESGSPAASENPTRQFCLLSFGTARALAAMCLFAQMDPDGPWKAAARRLAHGYEPLMLNKGDNESYLFSTWMYPGRPVEKPAHHIFDESVYVAGTQAWIAVYLVIYDRALQDPAATRLAERIMTYNMFDRQVNEPSGRFQSDALMGKGKYAHIYTHVMNVLACLYVYRQTGNEALLDRALKSYAYAKTQGEPLVGFFPDFAAAPGVPVANNSEIDHTGAMIQVALTLAKLGYDSCWDDADRWLRNQLAEAQLTQTAWLTDGHIDYSRVKVPPDFFNPKRRTTEAVVERSLGSFAGCSSPNDWIGDESRVTVQACCTASGSRALFAAWRDMLNYDRDTLKVNLLFNRASKWVDIDSHIPYTGRVVFRIKQPLNIEVRIPEWVNPGAARCEVDGNARELAYEKRYAQVGKVERGQTVALSFPITERTEKRNIKGFGYTFILRGNDVVHVDPPGRYSAFYQRGYYRTGQTLYQKVSRFISQQEISWW